MRTSPQRELTQLEVEAVAFPHSSCYTNVELMARAPWSILDHEMTGERQPHAEGDKAERQVPGSFMTLWGPCISPDMPTSSFLLSRREITLGFV